MGKLKQLGKILWGATSMALLVFAASPMFLNTQTVSSASDCDENAVIYCGVSSKTQLVNTINNGDGKHSDIKSKYGSIGIYANDISGANTYDGTVKRDGTVWVGSTQVASGVYSAGRSNMSSSTYWNGLYWRSPSISFNSDALSAYVYMYKGAFQYAIIKSCGNPVLKQLSPIKPGIYLVKDVSNLNSDPNWKDYNEGKPGDTLKYSIHVTNNTSVTAEGVTVWDVLPNHISLVTGSAQVHYGSSVTSISDSALTKGVRIGNFTPGTDAYVTFKVTIKNDFTSGTCQHVTNTGFAKSDYSKETSDKAYTNVCVTPSTTTTTTKPVTTTTKPITTTTKPVTTTTKPCTTTTSTMTTTTTRPKTTTTTQSTTTTTKPKTTTTTTKPTYELKIKKFEDKNRDGDHDFLEGWLSGWSFDVVGPNTSRLVTTGSNGDIVLDGLYEGTYTITEHQKNGWGPTEEAKLTKTIQLGSGDKTVEFGNYKLPVDQKYTITVNKFEDLDADTKKDENEALLSGWEFTLKGEGIEITEKTNTSGSITFEGLKAGTYTISENLQAGWRATTNAAQKVTVGPDRIVWFGNQRIPVTTTTKPAETPILPVTGPFQIFAGLAGTFGLGSSALFYRRSRKTVLKSLRSL